MHTESRSCEDCTEKDLKLWLEEQSGPATSQRMLRSSRNETGQGMECLLQPRG